jgi:hypothetical protein
MSWKPELSITTAVSQIPHAANKVAPWEAYEKKGVGILIEIMFCGLRSRLTHTVYCLLEIQRGEDDIKAQQRSNLRSGGG